MEMFSYIGRELNAASGEEVIRIDDAESGVEAVGVSQEIRQEDIRHAKQFRRELIAQTLSQIAEFEQMKVSELMFERERFWTTERRREGYIQRHEARDQGSVEELLTTLDLDNPEHQVILLEKLRLVYAALKNRLMIVEMETRRLMFKVYGETTGVKETPEERIQRLYGGGEESADAAEIVLIELDGMREQGKNDHSIYRQLMRRYHPDISSHEQAHQITQLLGLLYDSKTERFSI
jgi:hypothetical protein